VSNRGVFRGIGRGRSRVAAANVILDGAGSTLATGLKGAFEVPFDALIERVALEATDGNTGSITLDLYRLSEAERMAGVAAGAAASICGGAKPAISSGGRMADTSLNGWDALLRAGDWLYVNVDAVTTFTRLTFALTLRRVLV
jgi:hypothetical protein